MYTTGPRVYIGMILCHVLCTDCIIDVMQLKNRRQAYHSVAVLLGQGVDIGLAVVENGHCSSGGGYLGSLNVAK